MQRARNDHRRREGGFTLVELGVVLAILAILVAIAVPAYLNMVNRAREAEAQQVWSMVKTELWSYFVQYNKYPTPSGGWWPGIDNPNDANSQWKYTASGDETSATLTAKGYGRTLCWSIDNTGTVKSGRADGDGPGVTCNPQ